jgi:hypothetical protein
MYCPQCGIQSPQDQRFCRSCGANMKVIGKAVALSEAVARSDRGPLPVLKEMMKSIKIEHTADEISNALEQMNREITSNFSAAVKIRPGGSQRKEESSAQGEPHRKGHGLALLRHCADDLFILFRRRARSKNTAREISEDPL